MPCHLPKTGTCSCCLDHDVAMTSFFKCFTVVSEITSNRQSKSRVSASGDLYFYMLIWIFTCTKDTDTERCECELRAEAGAGRG